MGSSAAETRVGFGADGPWELGGTVGVAIAANGVAGGGGGYVDTGRRLASVKNPVSRVKGVTSPRNASIGSRSS